LARGRGGETCDRRDNTSPDVEMSPRCGGLQDFHLFGNTIVPSPVAVIIIVGWATVPSVRIQP